MLHGQYISYQLYNSHMCAHYRCMLPTNGHQICIMDAYHLNTPADRSSLGLTYFQCHRGQNVSNLGKPGRHKS